MERNEVFYDWLRAKFFEFEDNDTRVQQLSAAVTDLAEVLRKQPHEVRCYTLVALDANIPIDNPRIITTYEVLKKHWNSVEGKYPEPPRSILRGIILSALYDLGKENPRLCRIIYYTMNGYCQFVQFGSETLVIERIRQEFGIAVEDEASVEWSLADAPVISSFKPFKVKDIKLGSAKVSKDALQTLLNAGLEQYPDRSDYTSRSWIPVFADKTSSIIKETIEGAFQEFGQSLSTDGLETEINKFFAGVANTLSTAFNKSFQSQIAVERRSKLLWWKETLYSTTLRKGYREINAAVLPVVMAIDLVKLLPDVTPVSVDYLLTDTYRAIKVDAPANQTLSELLACFEDEEQQKLLAPHLSKLTDCGERTTLTAFLTQVLHDQKPLKKLTTYTGLRAEVEAEPEQLSVIILHDLLTERLINKANAA